MVHTENKENLIYKTCRYCKSTLNLNSFHKKKSGEHGVTARCKPCMAKWQKEYYSEENKKKRLERQSSPKYQLYIRQYRLKKYYNISLDDYDLMLKDQNNKCAICLGNPKGSPSNKYFAVDHCHKTGKIRQLLCGTCNTILGSVNENIDILKSMISYIEKHNVES